jgi:hypothetical protein
MQGSTRLPPESPPSPATAGLPAREGVRRLSVVHFLIALALLLVTMPFVSELRYGDAIEAALVTLVFLSAVMAVGGRRRTLITAAVLVTPAVVGTLVHHFRPGVMPREFTLVAGILFSVFVIVHLLGFILRARRVNFEVLCAAVATYLMLGIVGAVAHELAGRLIPHSYAFAPGSPPDRAMAGFEALYYSFGTLAPINYGDIVPVSNVARMLTMVEATTGLFFVTMLIARLVALYSSDQPPPSTGAQNPSPAGGSRWADEQDR